MNGSADSAQGKFHGVGPNRGPKFRPLIGVLAQTSGPRRAVRANPGQRTLAISVHHLAERIRQHRQKPGNLSARPERAAGVDAVVV
jgi:hypothetical protein